LRALLPDASKKKSQRVHRALPPKERVKIKGELPSPKPRAHQPLKDNLLQEGCVLATGLILAIVIKPLNEQIRGLFTKFAPLIALFDQFQNPS